MLVPNSHPAVHRLPIVVSLAPWKNGARALIRRHPHPFPGHQIEPLPQTLKTILKKPLAYLPLPYRSLLLLFVLQNQLPPPLELVFNVCLSQKNRHASPCVQPSPFKWCMHAARGQADYTNSLIFSVAPKSWATFAGCFDCSGHPAILPFLSWRDPSPSSPRLIVVPVPDWRINCCWTPLVGSVTSRVLVNTGSRNSMTGWPVMG